jgi:dienelactone hydrolase
MGKMIQLTASDGHTLWAYRAEPAGKPKGGLVVAMEIFGVNSHIRGIADGYAADGYLVIAPALFDRVQPGYEAGYTQDALKELAEAHLLYAFVGGAEQEGRGEPARTLCISTRCVM